MDLSILRIDQDMYFMYNVKKLLKERLAYMEDMRVFDCKEIKKIETIYKTKYSTKIYLKSDLKDEKNIIIVQLLLGSDIFKEVNTIINHFQLNMSYSNRMFDIKRYRGGKIRTAKVTDITKEILDYVLNKNRKRFRN